MVRDLAETPHTDIQAQVCGDFHLLTFGTYASPERTMLFDVNDFDETLPGDPGSGTFSASPQAWSWRSGRTVSPTPTAEWRPAQSGVPLRRRPLPLETLGGLLGLGQGKDYEAS